MSVHERFAEPASPYFGLETVSAEEAIKVAPTLIEVFRRSPSLRQLAETADRRALATPDEEILSSRERQSTSEMKGSFSSTIFYIELKNDGAELFKPTQFNEVFDAEEQGGSGHLRERAAYLLDRFLGFNLVLPTVIQEVDGRIGTAQRFIAGAKSGAEIDFEGADERTTYSQSEMLRMRIFDYFLSNTDRHPGNYITKDGKLFAVDHAYAFQTFTSKNALEYLTDHKGQPIPDEIRNRISDVLEDEELRRTFTILMSELISGLELNALIERMQRFIDVFEPGDIITRERIDALEAF